MPAPLQTFDLGQTWGNAQNIVNARTQNALAQQELSPNSLNNQYRQAQINALNDKAANPGSESRLGLKPMILRRPDGQGGFEFKAFQLSDTPGVDPQEVQFPKGMEIPTKGTWKDIGNGMQFLEEYGPSNPPPVGQPGADASGQGPAPLAAGQPTATGFVPMGIPPQDTADHRAAVEEATVTAGNKANLDPTSGVGAVEASKAQSISDVKMKVEAAKNKKAFATYQVARQNLSRALKNTTTGYFAGKIPAVTAMAQVAESGQKVIFPAVKSLVREAGEGVFTDRDAADIQAMLPTRDTHPDALPMVMYNIDSYIASKLGQPLPPLPEGAIETPSWIKPNDPRWNQLSDEEKMKVIEARPQ